MSKEVNEEQFKNAPAPISVAVIPIIEDKLLHPRKQSLGISEIDGEPEKSIVDKVLCQLKA